MKKFRRLAVLAGLAGLMAMPAAAADVSYTTVLSGSVVGVVKTVLVQPGSQVQQGAVVVVVETK